MTNDAQTKLINHVWIECLAHRGKQVFSGDNLAKEFFGKDADWIDIFGVLRDCEDIKIKAFRIKGVSEKLFEIEISPIFCSKQIRRLARRMYDYADQRDELFEKYFTTVLK